MTHDAVLLIAFGGPTSAEEIRPFLERVVRGRNVPPERLAQVEQNYIQIGGRSPLLDITRRQAHRLRWELAARELPLPVYVGMRNWHPFLDETLAAMWRDGVRRAVGIILSPLQSPAGWQRYMDDVAEASAALNGKAPAVDFAPPWAAHPLYIEAMSCRVAQALAQISEAGRAQAEVVFTAHSLPVEMAAHSPYEAELRAVAEQVAGRLGHSRFSVAYQSRSGPPQEPWLEPDIGVQLKRLAERGVRDVVVAPVGFVCDHVEVLYDLDVVASHVARELGLVFVRAQAANEHAAFIGMLADLVCHVATAKGGEQR